MSNPGFNIKVRALRNGFTIHRTRIDQAGEEDHEDYICDPNEIKTFLGGLIDTAVDVAKEDREALDNERGRY